MQRLSPDLRSKLNFAYEQAIKKVFSQAKFTAIPLGDFKDPEIWRWENVKFADNYYESPEEVADLGQKLINLLFSTTFTAQGRRISNFDLTVPLSGDPRDPLPAVGRFGVDSFIGQTQADVAAWYAGTANLSLEALTSRWNDLTPEALGPEYRSVIPILRSVLDLPTTRDGTHVGNTWYRSHNFVNFNDPQAPWEGIGTGWFFSPQGGGATVSTKTGKEVTFNNTQVSHGIDPAVPSVFNGNFEYGNLHDIKRAPVLVGGSFSTPGWSFHGGTFKSTVPTLSVVADGTGDYAAEMSTGVLGNDLIEHNRLYVPTNVNFLEFSYSVKDVERAEFPNVRTGQLSAFFKVGTEERFLGDVLFDHPEVLPETDPAAWHRQTFALPQDMLRDQQGNRLGQTGSVIFKLSYPGVQPPRIFGEGRIWLDDIGLVAQPGVRSASPLMVDQSAAGETTSTLSSGLLGPMGQAATSFWLGLRGSGLVEMPDGQIGVESRFSFIPTPNIEINANPINGGNQFDGGAGSGQSGLDDQFLLADLRASNSVWSNGRASSSWTDILSKIVAHQLSIDDYASLATDSHAVEAQANSGLGETDESVVGNAHFRHLLESVVSPNWPTIVESEVGGANLNVGGDFSSPGSNGTVPDHDVFDLDQLPLLPLSLSAGLRGQVSNLIPISEIKVAPGLGESEGQDSQSSLQHSPSFGSQTVPTDRNLVNHFAALAPGAPSGASIDPNTGVLTWAVPRTQAVGLYTIAVTVMDAGTPALMGQ